ncbi:MAG: diaminopimelate epimerase [Hyphomicrobiales bacterium]
MSRLEGIPFRKMNGLGNDFVVFDARVRPLSLTEAEVRAIADRKRGIGCDQLIVMERSDRADVRMRIFNQSGGEVESCGNASRCIADLLIGETAKPAVSIETLGGDLACTRHGEGLVTVDMGTPRFGWQDIPLAEEFRDTRAIELQVGPIDAPIIHSPSVVNVGNPHCIFWVKSLDVIDLAAVGPMLEHHPMFPERANISLAHVTSRDALTLKVWERGVGLTRACGTAACAAAVCAARKRLTGRTVTVTLPGGDLLIEWREGDDHILMTGPVSYDFEGVLPAFATEDA